MQDELVIKTPIWGQAVLFILICGMFCLGALVWQIDEISVRIICIAFVLIFGLGLICVFSCTFTPIVSISERGLTIPYLFYTIFVPWDNILQIKKVTLHFGSRRGVPQTQEYIGILLSDINGIKSTHTSAQKRIHTKCLVYALK